MIPDHERRYGKFSLDEEIALENPAHVMAIMARCLIMRCEHRYDTRRFEYSAWSPDFEIVPEGFIPPQYKPCVFFDADTNEVTEIRWEKLP